MARDRSTRSNDMARLRKRMDGSDNFMSAHQIKRVRVQIGQKDTPVWANSDQAVRKILLTAFPNLTTVNGQRLRAARWVQAITLVYRMDMPYNHASAEMGIPVGTLRSLLRNIRRSARGMKANGNGPKTGKHIGRPLQK